MDLFLKECTLDETPIPSYDFITALVKDVFGTYFVEPDSWKLQDDLKTIGRTYFADRKRSKCAVNERTIDYIRMLYIMAFTGNSIYDPVRISQTFTQALKKRFKINVDYLIFFDDDTEQLQRGKIQIIIHLVFLLLERIKDKESIPAYKLNDWQEGGVMYKLMSWMVSHAKNTFTEQVINNIHATDPEK